MPTYFPNIIDGNSCIGNTLSTLNIALTSLDTNLHNLSTYAVNSINYLSASISSLSALVKTEINFLSATIQSVSATLQTEVNYLSTNVQNVSGNLQTQINYLSSHYISNYYTQGTIYQLSNGQINWNMGTVGINATVTITANGILNNPTNLLFAGQEGNLMIVQSPTTGLPISGYGNLWNFNNYTSSVNLSVNGRTRIHYYYDGNHLLANTFYY